MIEVFSSDNDKSCFKVIDWISFYGGCFLRKQTNTPQINLRISNEEQNCTIKNSWYRNGSLNLNTKLSSLLPNALARHLNSEWKKIQDFTYFKTENKSEIKLGSFFKEINNNKYIDLCIARDVGFVIPESIITTSKRELASFLSKYSEIIVKGDVTNLEDKDNLYFYQGTSIIGENNLACFEDSFFPTFFQEYIRKEIEIRIFYIQKKCFSMAIFSQKNLKTKIDFRNYDLSIPNRNIPYVLPEEVQLKIIKFMVKSDLDTGSIDMILTPKGEYVFLEVNPSGQFDWLSQNCNYYLEQEIANYLLIES